jgi:hypothetical protein
MDTEQHDREAGMWNAFLGCPFVSGAIVGIKQQGLGYLNAVKEQMMYETAWVCLHKTRLGAVSEKRR